MGQKLFFVLLLIVTATKSEGDDFAPPAGLVDVMTINPLIKIDLRYATSQNMLGYAIYPPIFRCYVVPEIAQGLTRAQAWLNLRGYGLAVWDGWRPPVVQKALWNKIHDSDFVAHPGQLALHTLGVAVDVTVVDSEGNEVPMPSDFDAVGPSASFWYTGKDRNVAKNLLLLQHAMSVGGFQGIRTEWWHFVVNDWQSYLPRLHVENR
jgi:D-alanyl-D-alanine dipeptidase